MLAFHNDPAIKDLYLTRVRLHREADDLVKGIGWEDGKGCAIGCTLESYDHSKYPEELGVPVQLAKLEDAIFEGLPNGESQQWPERFLAAIRPGADLSRVWNDFAHWLLVDPEDGVIRFVGSDERTAKAIRDIAQLHAKYSTDTAAWNAARAAAWHAARAAAKDAAWHAAEAAAEDAAWHAAEAAARDAARAAAWNAAEAAARDTAWHAAKDAAYIKQSEKLLALLNAA